MPRNRESRPCTWARSLTISLTFGLVLTVAARLGSGETGEGRPTAPSNRHVQFIHLDGFRADVFRSLLVSGRLPHFEFLLSRGRISYDASTVDKTETMKIIQSYLTSRLDTYVVGWWQFSRANLHFRNFWLDPAEVLNYALGLEFPRYPTIQDYLRHRGETLVAGMSLHRRGVPFANYGRAYLEGAKAVYDHSYYNQADATMRYFLDIHERIARNPDEKMPAFSNLLLAAADEMSHLEGVTTFSSVREHCFIREEQDTDPTIFQILDDDPGYLEQLEDRYFKRVQHGLLTRKHERLCIELPLIQVPRDPSDGAAKPGSVPLLRVTRPNYVLAMIFIDIELGYLIDRFRSIRFDSRGQRRFEAPRNDLLRYMKSDRVDDSLFERTLFILFGDHGMVDTHRMMVPPGPEANPYRDPLSMKVSFLDSLNSALGLQTGAEMEELSPRAELGIDYLEMPRRLSQPYRYSSWQPEGIRLRTTEARVWAAEFFDELRVALRANLHERYWWLFFMRTLLVDPKLDMTLDQVAEPAVDLLADLYLRGDPAYSESEVKARRGIFERHVRLVYGGGARNNAEIFVPSCRGVESRQCTWARRPSYRQILDYRGGTRSKTTVVDALKAHPGVGLIFVREENDQISSGGKLPETIHIRVIDWQSNSGRITVWRDVRTDELVFRYRVDHQSAIDPLYYGELGRGEGTVGTYNEWNDRSAAPNSGHYYRNAVAGIGSYLYSDNPAIGDLLVLHRENWNFGSNGGGHGGIHRAEKQTLMLVSGPGVGSGPLYARSRYRTTPEGELLPDDKGLHYPTVLDVTPTALEWLGHREDALEAFARNGFGEYLRGWNRAQRDDIISQLGGIGDVERALAEAGFGDFRIEQFSTRLERLLQFVVLSGTDESVALPDYDRFRIDGNQLILETK